MAKKKTVGAFLFDYLHRQGIAHGFGIPGDFALASFRWLEDSPIEVVTLTHEPSVGFAADAYARIHGLGMAIVTYSVGGLNMVNSIACAYAEKSPVIVISGGPTLEDRSKDPLLHHKVRGFDTQLNIYKEITCAQAVLTDLDQVESEIMRVVEACKTHSRPVYIELPCDIVDEYLPELVPVVHPLIPRKSDPEVLEEVLSLIAERLNKAKKPVIVAGIELARFGLADYVTEFAKQHQIPIASTLLSKSVIRETNPLYIGVYSGAISEPLCHQYVMESDCVMLIGAFISDMLLGFFTESFNRKSAVILTRDQIKIGLQRYDDVYVEDVLAGLSNKGIKKRDSFKNPNPLTIPPQLEEGQKKEDLSVTSMFDILAHHIDEGNTVICDTGDALIGAVGLRTGKRSHFLSDAYYLSMGFATPAIVGAHMADPKSKIIALVGDGAFQMTGIELSTIAKYRLAPIVIVINNDGYGTQRHIIDGQFNNIHPWDYPKLIELLRYGKAVTVKTKGEFDAAMQRAKVSDELYLIEVVVPREDCSRNLKRMGEALHKLRDHRD